MNKKSEITSWALYDLANTIFATNVVCLYFPLWVTIDRGAPDKFYILPYYFSMVLAMFLLPFLGILSDSLKRYALFLNIFTIGCIICTALIGLSGNLFIGIFFFTFANLF
ncbi:MAG: MFS transporter, partial [Candidatus Omnitrophica bacterium]|nr:MFS transporter [Candidatus Omnitrophota bacterium]